MSNFAEISIGIIIGFMPVLPRFFKHLTSKEAGSLSRFEILSSASRRFWRRISRRSAMSEPSREDPSYYNRNYFSKRKAPRSTRAPQIETLNLTRSSLTLTEKYFPRLPSPIRRKDSSIASHRTTTPHSEWDEQRYGEIADTEKASSAGWT